MAQEIELKLSLPPGAVKSLLAHSLCKRPAVRPVFSYVTGAIFALFGRGAIWQEGRIWFIGRSTLMHASKAS
jgi:hypothetical protein